MPSDRPFIDRGSGELKTGQILAEAVPLAKLIAPFVAIGLVPLGLAFLGLGNSVFGGLLALVTQYILAVGAGVVLMYVIARGLQLSET